MLGFAATVAAPLPAAGAIDAFPGGAAEAAVAESPSAGVEAGEQASSVIAAVAAAIGERGVRVEVSGCESRSAAFGQGWVMVYEAAG